MMASGSGQQLPATTRIPRAFLGMPGSSSDRVPAGSSSKAPPPQRPPTRRSATPRQPETWSAGDRGKLELSVAVAPFGERDEVRYDRRTKQLMVSVMQQRDARREETAQGLLTQSPFCGCFAGTSAERASADERFLTFGDPLFAGNAQWVFWNAHSIARERERLLAVLRDADAYPTEVFGASLDEALRVSRILASSAITSGMERYLTYENGAPFMVRPQDALPVCMSCKPCSRGQHVGAPCMCWKPCRGASFFFFLGEDKSCVMAFGGGRISCAHDCVLDFYFYGGTAFRVPASFLRSFLCFCNAHLCSWDASPH